MQFGRVLPNVMQHWSLWHVTGPRVSSRVLAVGSGQSGGQGGAAQELDKEVRGEDDPPGVQAPGGVPGGAGGEGRGGGGAPQHLLCRGEEAAVQHQGRRGQQGGLWLVESWSRDPSAHLWLVAKVLEMVDIGRGAVLERAENGIINICHGDTVQLELARAGYS